jgi:hypothetical protein
MFLKRFREKSNQKYVNTLLDTSVRHVHQKKIETVGVLLNLDEFKNYDSLRQLLNSIGIKDNKVKFIAYIDDDESKPNSWDSFFNPNDFGWRGKITNTDLQLFIDTEFDALICFYNAEDLELKLVAASSKANFKIGINNSEPRLYDLIINIDTKHLQVFQNELFKYLKVLNKI